MSKVPLHPQVSEMYIGERERSAVSQELVAASALVILIHGTGSADPRDEGESWWQRESFFWRELDKELEGAAQCGPRSGSLFHWNGANSESARRKAGERLLDYITELESHHQRYHLIGHSHGGSVVWHALQLAAKRKVPLTNLATWTTIGTPFLRLRSPGIMPTAIVPIALLASSLIYLIEQLWTFVSDLPSIILMPIMPLLSLWMLWISIAAIGSYYLFLVVRRLISISVARASARSEHQAAGFFGEKWLGVWSKYDEAIGGLRNSLEFRGYIAPRWRSLSYPIWKRGLSLLAAPFRLLHNTCIAPGVDDFIFDRITRRLQGSDVMDLLVQEVTVGPSDLTAQPLPASIDTSLTDAADQSAGGTAARIRKALAVSAEARADLSALLQAFGRELSWKELVHNSYFYSRGVIQIIGSHMRRYEDSQGKDSSAATEAGAEGEPRKARSISLPQFAGYVEKGGSDLTLDRTINGSVSITLAMARKRLDVTRDITFGAAIGLLAIAAVALFDSAAIPYTSDYQIEQILATAPAVDLSATVEAEENQDIEAWFEKLVNAGLPYDPARRLIRPSIKARTFARVARGLANAGHIQEAHHWAQEALKLLDLLKSPHDTEFQVTLHYVAVALASARLNDETLGALSRLPSEDRSNAIANVIEDLLRSDFLDQAVRLSGDPSKFGIRPTTLLAMARELAKAKRYPEALTFGSAAAAASEGLEDRLGELAALVIVAEALSETGRATEATATAVQARDLARSLEDRADSAEALAYVASAVFLSGDRQQALTIAADALAEVSRIKDMQKRSEILAQVSQIFARAGVDKPAVTAALARPADWQRYMSLNKVVEALIERGLVTDALAVANMIPNEWVFFRVDAYSRVGLAFVSANDLGKATAVLFQAEADASSIEVPSKAYEKAKVLLDLASAFDIAGSHAEARRLALAAVQVIDQIPQNGPKESALLQAVRVLQTLNERRAASDILVQVGKAAELEGIGPGERSILMKEAATLHAKFGRFRDARLAAERCQSSDRLRAFTAIIGAYHDLKILQSSQ